MWQEHRQGHPIGLRTSRGEFDPVRPSLLCIHGAGGTSQGWLPQLSGLAGQVNVASLDLPGHLDTPGPSFDDVNHYAGWLAGFLAAGPIRPVLCGHSMGGAIAQTLALNHPELIRGLVLVGSGSRLKVLPTILEGIKQDFPGTVRLIVKFAYSDDAPEPLLRDGVDTMLATAPEVLLGDFTACDRFDISDRLDDIALPTLILVGENDKLTPVKYSQALAKAIPGAELRTIPQAGHMAHLENHKAVNQALLDFMAKF